MNNCKKTIKQSDITTTPIKLKYSASYASSEFINNKIISHIGINGKVPITGSIIQNVLKYRLIQQLYYQNYVTGSIFNSASYWDWNQQSTACSGSSDWENRYFPTGSNDKIGFLYISPQTYGEQISRKSISITSPTNAYNIKDDGNGNLIDTISANPIHVGNVIYSHGIVTITNPDYTDAICPEQKANWYNFPETPKNIMWNLTGIDPINYPITPEQDMKFVINEFTINGINYISSPRYYTLTLDNINLVNTVSSYFTDKYPYLGYNNGFTYTNLVDWLNSLFDEFGLSAAGYRAQLTTKAVTVDTGQKSGMGFYLVYPRESTFFIRMRSDWGTYDIFAYGHDALYQDAGAGYNPLAHGGYIEYDIDVSPIINGIVQE